MEGFLTRNKALRILTWSLQVVVVLLALVLGVWASDKYKTLHSFTRSDGTPQGSLILDGAGNLYGTTWNGGPDAEGTVFELTPNGDGTWTQNVLHSFVGTDGAYPNDALVFDKTGNLYGTASQATTKHAGAVFKLTPNGDGTWNYSVLYTFCSLSNCKDGGMPYAGLVFDQMGNLYGTTSGGVGGGVVYRLAPKTDGTWIESVLHTFCAYCRDGDGSFAGLIFDKEGNLYGTTFYGGATSSGVVFKLTPNADGTWKEKVLHSFSGTTDGAGPRAGLILDPAGSLYGTTSYSADSSNAGTAFSLTPNTAGGWKEKVLHQFTGDNDGGHPFGDLTFDAAGNLYGTCSSGGDLSVGVVFKLTKNPKGIWHETVVHNFTGRPGGPSPHGTDVRPSGRNLWDLRIRRSVVLRFRI